ncbi:MAG TPA: glycosyltransferase [Thermoplasmata archaeon]|nr:glycosyltransferase [Thermoplasmata archaeon]
MNGTLAPPNASRGGRSPAGSLPPAAPPAGPSSSPLVSVLVLAFRRHRFLSEAVGSVLGPEAGRGRCEVLVVSDPLEGSLREDLESRGARVIETDELRVGAMMAIGIRAARGAVLAFLDDDDVFRPGKIDRLIAVFHDPAVVHFHHRFVRVGPLREPIRSPEAPVGPSLTFELPLAARDLARIRRSWGYYNTSSHAVRRSALLASLDAISAITNYQDFALLALTHGPGRAVIDRAEVLTEYRTHPSQGNHDLHQPSLPEAHLEFLRGTARSCYVLSDRAPSPTVRRFSFLRGTTYELLLWALTGESVAEPRSIVRRALWAVAGSVAEGDLRTGAILALLLGLSVHRSWARRVYVGLKRVDASSLVATSSPAPAQSTGSVGAIPRDSP